MRLAGWIVIAVVILAAAGLGVGILFSNVIRETQIQNPPAQNATDESKPEVGGNDVLVLTISKPFYKQKESVTFTAKNNGNEALVFPNSVLGLEIINADTSRQYPIIAAQVIVSLEPGESRSITWHPEDSDGNMVEPGNYIAKIHTTPKSTGVVAEVNFRIIQS